MTKQTSNELFCPDDPIFDRRNSFLMPSKFGNIGDWDLESDWDLSDIFIEYKLFNGMSFFLADSLPM